MKRKQPDNDSSSTSEDTSEESSEPSSSDDFSDEESDTSSDEGSALASAAQQQAGLRSGSQHQDETRSEKPEAKAADQPAVPTRSAPTLPWMRVPLAIEDGASVPLPDVRGLPPPLAAALCAGVAETECSKLSAYLSDNSQLSHAVPPQLSMLLSAN